MNASWIHHARRELLAWRGDRPGWSYRPDGGPYAEPTALAMLALVASGLEPRDRKALRESAAWLATLQQPSGAVGISSTLPAPHWTTSLAILAWSVSDTAPEARERAIAWLLADEGETKIASAHTPFGHDASIRGWSWVAGTQAWLEPTAMAVLALTRAGHGEESRVHEGARLIVDRGIRTGGWNYGNSRVFDADLRPQPAPTGLALLALAGRADADAPQIEGSLRYLEQTLPGTRAAQSLAWGLLGLSAWGHRPSDADEWSEAALPRIPARSDRSVQMAYLLLAASKGDWLSLQPVERSEEENTP